MNAIIDNIETEIENEAKEIVADIKLDYKKVMAILRAHFGGDHAVIADMKKLAISSEAQPYQPQIGSEDGIQASLMPIGELPDPAIIAEPQKQVMSDPKPVDTIDGIGAVSNE